MKSKQKGLDDWCIIFVNRGILEITPEKGTVKKPCLFLRLWLRFITIGLIRIERKLNNED